MFDRLMLLARGKIIYFNEARLAVDYFSSIQYQCPDLSNPADYFMSMMSIEQIELEKQTAGETILDKDKIEEEYQERIKYFVDSYEASQLCNKDDEIAPGVRELDMGAGN